MVKGTPTPKVSEKLSVSVVEMIVEVAKRTGKELSDREVDIIAETTKEMGHDVGKVSGT